MGERNRWVRFSKIKTGIGMGFQVGKSWQSWNWKDWTAQQQVCWKLRGWNRSGGDNTGMQFNKTLASQDLDLGIPATLISSMDCTGKA